MRAWVYGPCGGRRGRAWCHVGFCTQLSHQKFSREGAQWMVQRRTKVRQIIRNQKDGRTHRDCDQKAATPATKLFGEGSKKVKWMGPSSTACKGCRRGCNGDGGALASAGQLDYHR
jgi:hypothetical protein